MIHSYSVHDAAAVLGIPETRVWELIARGVLAGDADPDGGMRVQLKPNPAERGSEDARTGNGNGHTNGSREVELSPFRELLNEFRNLTERYGQALLALGEARGEVASLRSRVDLLEARIDLRLPATRASTVAWEIPDPVAPPTEAAEPAEAGEPATASAPVADAPPEPDAQTEPATADLPPVPQLADHADEPRGRRRRVPIWADPSGFAQALQRAQDPALAELPGAREAAEALAELQREAEAPPAVAVAVEAPGAADLPGDTHDALPDGPVATAAPVETLADELPPMEAIVTEAAPPVAEPEAPGSPYSTELIEPDWFADGDFSWLEQAQAAEEAGAPEASAVAEPMAESEPEPMLEAVVDAPMASAPAPEVAEPEVAMAGPEVADFDLEAAAPAADAEAAPRAPAGTEEVELMWLGDEFEEASLEVATPGWRPEPDEPATAAAPPSDLEPVDRAGPMVDASPAEPAFTEETLEQMAHREGWQADEIEAIRSLLGRPPADAPVEPPPPPPPPSTTAPTLPTHRPAPGGPEWLRGRRGPAANAYRRIRRIFP